MTSRSQWQRLGWATTLGAGLLVLTSGGAIANPVLVAQSSESFLLEHQGTLEDGDTVLQSDGSLYDEHTFEGKAGQQITVTLESAEFDTYLIVLDPSGSPLDQNDDISEDNYNSALTLTLPSDGLYTILANSYDSTGRGNYTLIVSESSGEVPPMTLPDPMPSETPSEGGAIR